MFTQHGVPVVHVLDAHLNVFDAKVHFQIFQVQVPLAVALHFAGLDVHLGLDALCERHGRVTRLGDTPSYPAGLTVFAPVLAAAGCLDHDQHARTPIVGRGGYFRDGERQLEL